MFLIQLKVYGVIIIFLYSFILFRFVKEQKFLILFKSTIFPLFIGVLWLLKNVSISGCFFYPVKITCFKNFSWYSKDIDKLIIDTRDFHNAYNIEKNFFSWFRDFFIDGKYAYIYQNYLISFLIILFLYKFLFTTKNKKVWILFSYLLLFCLHLLIYYISSTKIHKWFNDIFSFLSWL